MGRDLVSSQQDVLGNIITDNELKRSHGTMPVLEQLISFDQMIKDLDLLQLISGQMLEPLNVVRKYVRAMENGDTITGWRELIVAMEKIKSKDGVFQRLMPYRFLLSHLMRLGNIAKPEASKLKNRISLMIMRDRITTCPEDSEVLTPNFWDGLEAHLRHSVDDNIEGWKAKILTEPRRTIRAEVAGTSSGQKPWYRRII
jgi:hypothetical protein